MNRIHWPSLLIILGLILLFGWLAMKFPAGPEGFCRARGREWFPELGRCL